MAVGAALCVRRPRWAPYALRAANVATALDVVAVPSATLQEWAAKCTLGCLSLGVKGLLLHDSWVHHVKYNVGVVVAAVALEWDAMEYYCDMNYALTAWPRYTQLWPWSHWAKWASSQWARTWSSS